MTLLMLVLTFLVPSMLSFASPQIYHWRHYVKAQQLFSEKKYAEAAHELEHAISQLKTNASYYMLLAQSYEKLEKFQLAANNYYKAGELYKATDYNAYLVNKSRGDAWTSQIEVFSYEQNQPAPKWTLGKHEPLSGAYFGAFVEYDQNIGHRNVQKFNQLTGKQHSMYFTYHDYGKPFPINWANQVKNAGGAIQLAYEPRNGLKAVQDNAYLREFARACKAFGAPIFLRYAAEMNGTWVPWYGNPSLYIEKFRLISKVMKEEAPNVAMVWAPNTTPQNQIDRYYPGDAWVDWVAVNMYSVYYYNGDATQSASYVNPLDMLDYVYKTYADRKPMMIAEYGATHFSKAGNMDTTQFSINKMNMLYQGIKMKYPRVKAVNWFSVNTLENINNPDRRLNNFSLSENSKVLNAYRAMIKDPYFLSSVQARTTPTSTATSKIAKMMPLSNRKITSKLDGYAWIKTYDPFISRVDYKLNGKFLSSSTQYPYRFTVDVSKLSKGKNTLVIAVFDSKKRLATRQEVVFTH
jgi:hypothetical protein